MIIINVDGNSAISINYFIYTEIASNLNTYRCMEHGMSITQKNTTTHNYIYIHTCISTMLSVQFRYPRHSQDTKSGGKKKKTIIHAKRDMYSCHFEFCIVNGMPVETIITFPRCIELKTARSIFHIEEHFAQQLTKSNKCSSNHTVYRLHKNS